MPEHVFTVVARGRSVDAQDNNLTLFSILEQVGSPSLPIRLPELTVATLWYRNHGEEGTEWVQRTRFLDPDGAELFHIETSFILEQKRQRVLAGFGNIPFEKAGVHRVEISLRPSDASDWGEPKAVYPLDVVVSAPADDASLLPQEDTETIPGP